MSIKKFSVDDQIFAPLRFSICGKTKVGKTTLAATLPNNHIVNFSQVDAKFREVEIEKSDVGDSFFTLRKMAVNGEFDLDHYYYVTDWKEYEETLHDIVHEFRVGKNEPLPTITIDDSRNWRFFARDEFEKVEGHVPIKYEWSKITDMLKSGLKYIRSNGFSVILIHQMKERYDAQDRATGEFVGEYYPNPDTAQYLADLIGELSIKVDVNGKRYREFKIDTNGDRLGNVCDVNYSDTIINPTMLDIYRQVGIEKYRWPKEWQDLPDPIPEL